MYFACWLWTVSWCSSNPSKLGNLSLQSVQSQGYLSKFSPLLCPNFNVSVVCASMISKSESVPVLKMLYSK